MAADRQIPLVPFLLEGVATDERLMQRDGIHPGADAQAQLLANVWPKLEPLLEASAAGEATPGPHGRTRRAPAAARARAGAVSRAREQVRMPVMLARSDLSPEAIRPGLPDGTAS